MYLTNDELNKRLSNAPNVQIDVIKEKRGRPLGSKTKNDFQDKVDASVLGEIIGQDEASKLTGIPQSQISRNSRGIDNNSTHNKELEKEVASRLKKNTDAVKEESMNQLLKALGIVSNTLPNVKKATEAASVAKDMAAIHREMQGGVSGLSNHLGVQIIINAPEQKTIDKYEIIDA